MSRRIQDLKLAFIGVSHWHVPLYFRAVLSDGLQVTAVSDPDEAIANKNAKTLGCKAYTDGIELLDAEKPDFVFAFAPHHEMPELALALIERNIPFAIEKPLGICANDVERVMEAAEKKNVFCAIPFVWRYSDLVQKFKEAVQPEEIVHMAFKFVAGPPSRYLATSKWMLETSLAGGGCMTNLGVHFLDLAMYLTGCTEADVLSSCYHRYTEYDIECYASSLLQMKTGASVVLETGYSYPMDVTQRDNRWNIVTKNGYYTLEQDYFEQRVYGEPTNRLVMSTDSDVYYPIFVRETLKQYLNGEKPRACLPEMLAVRRVLDEMDRKG
ncbi:MAG: Gfo/Idh/MocA family oxidoreductase [Clostridiales bacterium]|nr:Gfo/Idh/MocA family oxidoreductase [Clostridiales bacterium]